MDCFAERPDEECQFCPTRNLCVGIRYGKRKMVNAIKKALANSPDMTPDEWMMREAKFMASTKHLSTEDYYQAIKERKNVLVGQGKFVNKSLSGSRANEKEDARDVGPGEDDQASSLVLA